MGNFSFRDRTLEASLRDSTPPRVLVFDTAVRDAVAGCGSLEWFFRFGARGRSRVVSFAGVSCAELEEGAPRPIAVRGTIAVVGRDRLIAIGKPRAHYHLQNMVAVVSAVSDDGWREVALDAGKGVVGPFRLLLHVAWALTGFPCMVNRCGIDEVTPAVAAASTLFTVRIVPTAEERDPSDCFPTEVKISSTVARLVVPSEAWDISAESFQALLAL